MRPLSGALTRITRPKYERTVRSHPRILKSSEVWGGKAVVAGTRVPVFMVHARLESGWTEDEVRQAYPRLTAEDVAAVRAYASAHPRAVREDRRAYEQSLPREC